MQIACGGHEPERPLDRGRCSPGAGRRGDARRGAAGVRTASTARGLRSSVDAVTAPGCHLGRHRMPPRTGSWEWDHRRGYPGRGARRPVRNLRPRAVLCGAVRLLRLQHLHALRAGRVRRVPGRLAGRGAPRAVTRSVASSGARPVDTVFVGGGTPSLLGAQRLGEVLDAVRSTFGLAPGAEVTTESNPESTSPEFFAGLVEAGFTRVSLGMQSAAPHVLRRAGAAAHPGPGGRGGAGGAGGRARARQPRPDLRHAGGDRRRPARRRWTPCWRPGWTTSRRTR